MPKELNLAIVGLGLVGKRHADAILQSGDANLCAVVEPTLGESVNVNSNLVPCYADLESMMKTENPDGVILSTPTPLHLEQGLPVFCHRLLV